VEFSMDLPGRALLHVLEYDRIGSVLSTSSANGSGSASGAGTVSAGTLAPTDVPALVYAFGGCYGDITQAGPGFAPRLNDPAGTMSMDTLVTVKAPVTPQMSANAPGVWVGAAAVFSVH
jgi:hypothetical protein